MTKILKEDNEGIHQEMYVILTTILMKNSLGIENDRGIMNLKVLDNSKFKKTISIFRVNLNFLIHSYLTDLRYN